MALITCPECKKKISEMAGACPHCGLLMTAEKAQEIKRREDNNRKVGGLGCVAVLAVVVLAWCSSNANHSGSSSSDTKAASVSSVSSSNAPPSGASPPAANSKWTYQEDVDSMRATKTSFADLESENELHFGFPYEGGKATLTIRKRPKDGLNVFLRISGQFLCNTYNDDTVAVKFDQGVIENFSCSEPTDASTGILFINSAARFVHKLKQSKAVIIEAPFFQNGRQQMQFDVRGLVWH